MSSYAILAAMTSTSSQEIQQKIGRNLKRIREEQGFTQEELAKAAGISPSYYNKIENGKKNFSANLENLCKVLKVKSSDILPY